MTTAHGHRSKTNYEEVWRTNMTSNVGFTKAIRKRSKLRLALDGPSSSGKTFGALMIAKGIGGKIAVIDTERGSAALYSDLVDFDTLELSPPFSPERFVEAIHTAAAAGYDVLVIDSITHEWDGSGGCLDINESMAHAKFKGNTWAAWNETTPRHRAFVDAILQAPMHVIATMRSKTETVQGDDKKVRKLGMKAVQREGMEYEFAVVFSLEHDRHTAIATKDRTRLFGEPHVITEETGRRVLAWLDSGATPVMMEGELRDHLSAIEAAADVDSLRQAFETGWKSADRIGDPNAKTKIATAKSARKAILMPAGQTNGATHAAAQA